MTVVSLTADAQNRALRSFVQGLGIDVLVAIGLVLATTFDGANGWGDLEWSILAFSLLKSVVQACASYVMRKYLDRSSIPTPLPPGDVA